MSALLDHLATPSALVDPRWWEWSSRVSGLDIEPVSVAGRGSPPSELAGAVFRDRRGRVAIPPQSPYLPISYTGVSEGRGGRAERFWLETAEQFAQFLIGAGLATPIILPVGFFDARPFTWVGLRASVCYTYIVDLPRDPAMSNPSVHKRSRKASGLGYQAGRSSDWPAIYACLRVTEVAKGFDHRISLPDLELGEALMGPEMFRGYVVRDRSGEVASAGVRIHVPGHRAVDWVQGATRQALKDGVNQLMYGYVMDDLAAADAPSFDLGGANIREVAAAKSSWGYPLVPQLVIEQPGFVKEIRRQLARHDFARSAVRRARAWRIRPRDGD